MDNFQTDKTKKIHELLNNSNQEGEKNWSKRPVTESVGNVQTFGINSVTIYDGDPYFFLFSDVDTKDMEQLRRILQVYKQNNLSCYFYETTKGWHVVSPVLLKLRKWTRLVNQLRPLVKDYSFDTIRYTRRYTDGRILYFEEWNNKNFESYDLHYLFRNKFECGFDKILENYVSTKLQWTSYNQLRITKKCHY